MRNHWCNKSDKLFIRWFNWWARFGIFQSVVEGTNKYEKWITTKIIRLFNK